jgi:zinc/manganese transport system substrate-binding protein
MRTILIITRLVRPALALLLVVGSLAACDSGRDESLEVVVTTNILGDVVGSVVGPDAVVTVLIPEGADPHDYRPSSRQAAAIQQADLVVANGLGLEEGLEEILEASSNGVPVLAIGPLLEPLLFGDGDFDPHVWLDPVRMAAAAGIVAERMTTIDPDGRWAERAVEYARELEALDREIADVLAVVPPARRALVTNHASLGYFADRYGFRLIGTVIPGGSPLAAPSSAELAELVETISRENVKAIFAETTESTALADAVAAEAGTDVAVVELYTGSLGPPGSEAGSLVGMLRVNAQRIAAALA